ncbi:MAG: type II toxin-antitoxin system YafQ family toxin [Chloroflexi bacterium]|nr:type II toxin-antitoxin system YafQ family toxin [Chloroflexota bacterium]
MRTTNLRRSFRRDYRREMRGRHRATLEDNLQRVLDLPSTDQTLPLRHRDHAMTGNWEGYRNCYIRFDLVLLYRKIGNDILELARLGSHSELGLA